MIDTSTDTSTDQDPVLTLGQRMVRGQRVPANDSDVPAGSVGTPSAGATPNTAEPHQQTAAAAGDTAAQSPSSSSPSKPSIGQRMVSSSSSSSPTDGIKAYNNDGSPAETTTGTDAAGKPTISIAPKAAASTAPAGATSAPASTGSAAAPVSGSGQPISTIGQRLMNLKPPPTAPQLDPNYSATQQAVRNDSVVTPKTDANGKTLDQYKPGFGTRLLRAVSDFTQGGIGGVLNGAINPRAPGFYGKGAVNNQYTKDEINRQNRLGADKAATSSMDDEYSQKEKGYGHELTSYNDAARAAGTADLRDIQAQREQERKDHDKAIEDLRQQLTDAKDPATKLKAETDARATIGKQLGLQGEALQRYSLYGDKSSMDDVNAAKAKNAEDRLGIQNEKNRMEQEKIDNAKAKNTATFKDQASIDKYSDQWYLKQRDQVRKEKGDALKNAGGDAEKAQGDYAEIEKSYQQRQQEFENRKQQWYGQVKSGKPVTVQNTDQGIPDVAPASAPTNDSDIPQPIASVRTGAPIAAPAQQPQKSISKADVQALANKHSMKYEDAAKQFTGKGYAIQ